MEQKLTVKERQDLMKRHHTEREERIRDRIKAVLAYNHGYSYSEIARILLLDDETIRRHVDDFWRENKLSTNNGGSDSKLTDRETRALTEHLADITYLYVKHICQYVKQRFNNTYSISGMTKWLSSNGFCYKKSHAVSAKTDKEQQRKFICFYQKLMQKAGTKDPIYFAGSVHSQYQTQLVYGSILKGIRKEVATNGKQKRLNFIGGICLEGHRFIYQQADTVNAEAIALFLTELRKCNPEKCKIYLIWDQAGYHKDKEVQSFAKGLGIELHYLPFYSPNLNSIERLWKIVHEKVRYNQYYSSFSDFKHATLGFFKHIGRQKTLLRARITDNFHVLHSLLLAT